MLTKQSISIVLTINCLLNFNVALNAVEIAECAREIEHLNPVPAIHHISHVLDSKKIVFIGERHSTNSMHQLYDTLLESKEIQNKIDDVMVEFLSSFHQSILDAYLIDLKPMSFEEIAPLWRDVPGIFLEDGDNMAAYQFIQTARSVNEKLDKDKRIRVLGGDSYLDWSKVNSQWDWGTALNRRDRRFLEVLWDEVIDRGHSAIAILGRGHVKRIDPTPPNWINLVELIDQRLPDQSYVIHLMYPEMAKVDWPAPSILSVNDTCLASLHLEKDYPEVQYGDQVDAVLFTGKKLQYIPTQPFPNEFVKELESRSNRIK